MEITTVLTEPAQNNIIEERVLQVADLREDVVNLDYDINFLFEEQVIQD